MQDLRPEAIVAPAARGFEHRLYGVFREPLWFRLPLACLAFSLAFEILSAASEMTTSGDWRFMATAVVGLEPLGSFLGLMSGALILPRSFVLRWFEARKRTAFTLVVAWVVVLAAISALVLLGALR